MKHLKSSLEDLKELSERGITVYHISEPLVSFDEENAADQVREFMEKKDYDVVGVRQNGIVSGYALKRDLHGGRRLGEYLVQFEPSELLPKTTPLVKVLHAMRNSSRIFILAFGQVGGIVTKGDLQKAPVRMWLFGLISLIEMQMLRGIRDYYPADSWESLISPERLKKAKQIFEGRRKGNMDIDLADCLQFCDKRDIVLKNHQLLKSIELDRKKLKEILESLEGLRDKLAHTQDIETGKWPEIMDLAEKAEEILRIFEKINTTP